MNKYVKCSDIPYYKIEFEERCHNDRWTEIHEIAYKTEIDRIPAADVLPVHHGRWQNPEDTECYQCSVCGKYRNQEWGLNAPIFDRFCPNCGARMDKDGDGNETDKSR